MQNDNNNNQANIPQPIVGSQQAAENLSQQNNTKGIMEYGLLGLGIVAVMALLFNFGALLGIIIPIFLIVAIVSIGHGMMHSKPKIYKDIGNGQFMEVKQPRSPAKIVGIILLLLVLAPILAYGALILFLLIMFGLGGGRGS